MKLYIRLTRADREKFGRCCARAAPTTEGRVRDGLDDALIAGVLEIGWAIGLKYTEASPLAAESNDDLRDGRSMWLLALARSIPSAPPTPSGPGSVRRHCGSRHNPFAETATRPRLPPGPHRRRYRRLMLAPERRIEPARSRTIPGTEALLRSQYAAMAKCWSRQLWAGAAPVHGSRTALRRTGFPALAARSRVRSLVTVRVSSSTGAGSASTSIRPPWPQAGSMTKV